MDPSLPYSRKNPFPASLAVNRKLTADGSNKDTRHFEIDLRGSGLEYEPGDSLGILPSNDPALVEAILDALGFSGSEIVQNHDGQKVPIRGALARDFIITEPSKQFLDALAAKDAGAARLGGQHGSTEETRALLGGRDVLDLLLEYPGAVFDPAEFAVVLRKLQPRLYSIASSRRAAGDSAHLTVAVVRYTPGGRTRERKGVCSSFLAERAVGGTPVPVCIHSSKHFRLPDDPSTACIMVGPGTGIAPFRAFLQERAATGATGPNWLLFGEQHAATDFFYKEEFEHHLANGTLTKFHTAFSRDQDHKIYVQDRLLEHGAEIYRWILDGAYFYVCGDASRMAKDVDAALHEIAVCEGGMTCEGAGEFVTGLKKEKRYRRDVY
jgi:sulfite reductase (NADPH) flavoprotein alpha-component